jgi:hypothetical protein
MCQADVSLAWREIYGLIASKGVTSRKDITALSRNGREWHSCLSILIHLVICHTTFFADKNKVSSVHLS